MNTLQELLQEQLHALQSGKDFVVVTIMDADGLARTAGKMIVYDDGTISGTVGGGMWEKSAIHDAKLCLAQQKSTVRYYDHSEELYSAGIQCKGKLTVSLEYCSAQRTQLVIVGGGHVGNAVIRAAKPLGFAVTLLDTRGAAEIGDSIQAADRFIPLERFADVASAELPKKPYYVVSTYGHQVDAEALYGVLSRNDAAYIGMLGSTKKIAAIFSQLENMGIMQEQLSQIYAPIGLDLGGETPEELAVSILGEILKVKYQRSGMHLTELRRKNA